MPIQIATPYVDGSPAPPPIINISPTPAPSGGGAVTLAPSNNTATVITPNNNNSNTPATNTNNPPATSNNNSSSNSSSNTGRIYNLSDAAVASTVANASGNAVAVDANAKKIDQKTLYIIIGLAVVLLAVAIYFITKK